MIEQPRADPYEASVFFPDGRAMRPLVAGTVPRSKPLGPPELTLGMVAGAYVTALPVKVTRPFVETGGERFDVHCAPCHGVLGDGRSQVAENMQLRKPPSFHVEPYASFPPGRIYAVVTHGYGFMRSYAAELRPRRSLVGRRVREGAAAQPGQSLAALPARRCERRHSMAALTPRAFDGRTRGEPRR